jgi:hypothetical protein
MIYHRRRKIGHSKRLKTQTTELEEFQQNSFSNTAPVKQDPNIPLIEPKNLSPSTEKTPTKVSNMRVTTSGNSLRETNHTASSFEKVAPLTTHASSANPPEFILTPKLTEVMRQAGDHYTNVF